ncbi:hypothetical protein O9G_003038 [Rozella allomycis CSF55]|uniref:Uncharacterized protein n=1 Tax=Rozella allomycis (strain CSF55) TaxID=988480 RepID=A0A075AZ26_ROZAC|nr:hypothetical protein O9G_003038 [Rozella allomycis CSF55]|eukprot:EPZ35384.1 hypothetical protein O9G_003038 [Rozella allomycis CSF55]
MSAAETKRNLEAPNEKAAKKSKKEYQKIDTVQDKEYKAFMNDIRQDDNDEDTLEVEIMKARWDTMDEMQTQDFILKIQNIRNSIKVKEEVDIDISEGDVEDDDEDDLWRMIRK